MRHMQERNTGLFASGYAGKRGADGNLVFDPDYRIEEVYITH